MGNPSIATLTEALTSHDWILRRVVMTMDGQTRTITFARVAQDRVRVTAEDDPEPPQEEDAAGYVASFVATPAPRVTAGDGFMNPLSTGTWRITQFTTGDKLLLENTPDSGEREVWEIALVEEAPGLPVWFTLDATEPGPDGGHMYAELRELDPFRP